MVKNPSFTTETLRRQLDLDDHRLTNLSFRCSRIYHHLLMVTTNNMGDVMEVEDLNYSEDPFPDRVIFGNPNLSSPASGSAPPSGPTPSSSSPVVSYPRLSTAPLVFGSLSIESPALDFPPLSPGTLHFLTANNPPLPSFDMNPLDIHLQSSSLKFFTPSPEDLHASRAPNPPISTSYPSGCFETLVVKVKSATQTTQEGSPDPLSDHPSAPPTGKQKAKCVRATSKDITISFGESSAIGVVALMASTVLVEHVCGRAYYAIRLTPWVCEIWGDLLKELPEVQILPRGWFSLHFAKENYTDLVLTRYQHIEMAPMLLKRWSPLFDLEREQIGARPLWVRLSRLPLQYQCEEVFVRIGNSHGTYLVLGPYTNSIGA